MIIFAYSYYIDKGKEEEYLKWSAETGAPFWLKQPGVVEMRSYSARGSNKRTVIVEMESFEAWGKLWDKPDLVEISNKFAEYTHGLKWTLLQEAARYSP
jgi:hypothetical protein